MLKYNITISSKNKKILQNFLNFLQQKLPTLKILLISKYKKFLEVINYLVNKKEF